MLLQEFTDPGVSSVSSVSGVSVFQVFQCFRCFSVSSVSSVSGVVFCLRMGFSPIVLVLLLQFALMGQVLPIHFMRGENANDDECSGSGEVVL
jgi:hypothetical protein